MLIYNINIVSIILIILLFVFYGLYFYRSRARLSEWKTFEAPDRKFKIEVQGILKHKNYSHLSGQIIDTYLSKSVIENYVVLATTYVKTADISDVDALLNRELNNVVVGKNNNKIISSDMGYVGKYRSVDYLMQYLGHKDRYARGKMILAGQTLYNLTVSYRERDYNENDYNRFINSFTIQQV
jgi:hypothetical protein